LYDSAPESLLKSNYPESGTIRIQDIQTFQIEENEDTSPPTANIYFRGRRAIYLIGSAHISYASIYADMQLKAQIWLWIQHKRSSALASKLDRSHWPSLKLLGRDLPVHLRSRIADPLHTFQTFFLERLLESHLSGENLPVGPSVSLPPRWTETQLMADLEERLPVRT
jgi:hypothetical protein